MGGEWERASLRLREGSSERKQQQKAREESGRGGNRNFEQKL